MAGPADEAMMRLALDQAQNAWLVGEVPVGAVIVRDTPGGRQVVATGYNRPVTDHDPTAHAEIVALRHAAHLLGNSGCPSARSTSRSSRARCARWRCCTRASSASSTVRAIPRRVPPDR